MFLISIQNDILSNKMDTRERETKMKMLPKITIRSLPFFLIASCFGMLIAINHLMFKEKRGVKNHA